MHTLCLAPTLHSLLRDYIRVRLLAPPSVARYGLTVRNLTRFVAGETALPSDIRLDSINLDTLVRYRADCLERMRPVSFNTERRHLSALFNEAVEGGLLPKNPIKRVRPAPVPRGQAKALSRDAMQCYIDWLQCCRRVDHKGRAADRIQPQWFWHTVLRTFYFTGMRKRQLLGLVWDDIDFKGKTILLASSSSKTKLEWKIPLQDALAADLQDLLSRTRSVCNLPLGQRQVFCLPLFSARKSCFRHAVMRPDNLDHFFQRLRRVMPEELPRLSAHRIRHTTATILANNVKNLKLVQEQLGHASIATTYGYVHADMDAMRQAVGVL